MNEIATELRRKHARWALGQKGPQILLDAADEIDRLSGAPAQTATGSWSNDAELIALCMDMLGDVPGETLDVRLERFIGAHITALASPAQSSWQPEREAIIEKCAQICNRIAINAERRAADHTNIEAKQSALDKYQAAQECEHSIRALCSVTSTQQPVASRTDREGGWNAERGIVVPSTHQSPPDLLTSHKTAERDPSVMPSWAGGDTASSTDKGSVE